MKEKTEKSEKKQKTQEQLQQELQEKYGEYQMIEEQLKQFQEQFQTLKKQEAELEELKGAIQSIEQTKEGTEMFVPLSSGIFVKAEIKGTQEVLVNVGDNVVVPKTIMDALLLIEKQQREIVQYQQKSEQNLQIFLVHQVRIEEELQGLLQQKEMQN